MKGNQMAIRRKHVGLLALVVIALFLIAAPLGDKHHGIGQHHAWAATLGQSIFVTFLISAVLLIVVTGAGLVQFAVHRVSPAK
jgi:hypothetical protein